MTSASAPAPDTLPVAGQPAPIKGQGLKTLGFALFSVALAIFGGFMAAGALGEDDSPFGSAALDQGFGAVVALTGAVAGWFFLRRALMHGRTVVSLGPEGLFDARSTRSPIPWPLLEEVVEIWSAGKPGGIAFTSADPAKARELLRPMARFYASRGKVPGAVLVVAELGTEASHPQLVAAVLEAGTFHGAPFISALAARGGELEQINVGP